MPWQADEHAETPMSVHLLPYSGMSAHNAKKAQTLPPKDRIKAVLFPVNRKTKHIRTRLTASAALPPYNTNAAKTNRLASPNRTPGTGKKASMPQRLSTMPVMAANAAKTAQRTFFS